MSAVDENGENQVDKLEAGDVWYFPKGVAHTLQGIDQSSLLHVLYQHNQDWTTKTNTCLHLTMVCKPFLEIKLPLIRTLTQVTLTLLGMHILSNLAHADTDL